MSAITKMMEKVMMKKIIVVGITVIALLAANQAQADVCGIVNGSFEDDGPVDFPPPPGKPNGWDVNIPDYDKFDGYIDDDWVTDPNYNLTLYSEWLEAFEVNDMAVVSQPVELTDANQIFFDLKLGNWNSDKVSAVVLVDGEVVWDSNDLGSGEYYDQVYEVEDKYRDETPHTLSFGIRVKVSETLWQRYFSYWDFIVCEGFSCLPGDFNHDGLVNFLDFAVLANYWGNESAPAEYDLYEDGTIDLRDLGVFVEDWLKRSCIEEPI